MVPETPPVEDRLQRSHALLRMASRLSRTGAWSVELPGVTVTLSEEACAIQDLPADFAPTIAEATNFCAPEAREGMTRVFDDCVRDGTPFDIELQTTTASGRRVWVRVIGEAVRDGAGAIHRVQGAVQDISERKGVEQALGESHATFHQLADNIADVFWIRSPDMRKVHFISPAFERIWGRPAAILYSHPERWPDYTLEEDRAGVRAAFATLMADARSIDLEYRIVRPDGEIRWIHARGFQIRDSADTLIRLTGIVTDITDRKRAELELVRTHRALELLTRCNEVLIRAGREQDLLDDTCRIIVEIGGYRMGWIGYAQDDDAKSITALAHAGVENGYLSDFKVTWNEHEPRGQGPVGQVIRSGLPVLTTDFARDPTLAPWLAAARERGYRSAIRLPLRSADRTFGLLGLYTADIVDPGAQELTLLQEMADNLAFGIASLRARARVHEQAALLDIAHEAIHVQDLDGRITYWNKWAERTYGWTAAEAIGRTTVELLGAGAAASEEIEAALAATGEYQGERSKRTRDGRDLTVEVRWTLVRNADGHPTSILAISNDITERKRLDSQRLRAQRMESIGTLAGGVAHDLNNVLAPILMSLELMKDVVTDDSDRYLLTTLEGSARRGADLVKQVLAFARGVEGQRIAVNPHHLMRDLLKVMLDTFPKNIDVRFTPARGLWTVTGDPTQIHQVLLNLCVNARDAMPEGGCLTIGMGNVTLDGISATVHPDASPGTYVVVTVEDTGTGIPPEIRDRICEPFFTTKEMGQGTGLGLSTTQAIVKSHGGWLSVASEMGRGTAFTVHLPAGTTEAAGQVSVAEQIRLPRGQGELVLVVDDEAAIRAVAQRTLERFGYRVLPAVNGAHALALYTEHRDEIAVVLTDMAMPVMDGPALILAIKAMNPLARIVGSSGLASGGALAGIGADTAAFVPKPYTAEILLVTLKRVLSN